MHLDARCGDCAWSLSSLGRRGFDLSCSYGSTASSAATATTCSTRAVAAVETDYPCCYNVIFTNPKPSAAAAAATTAAADGSRPNRANSEAAASGTTN